jgi:hypothetical protein
MRMSFSQLFVSIEGGEKNGCQEESQESCQEGGKESQEGREEEVVSSSQSWAGVLMSPGLLFSPLGVDQDNRI